MTAAKPSFNLVELVSRNPTLSRARGLGRKPWFTSDAALNRRRTAIPQRNDVIRVENRHVPIFNSLGRRRRNRHDRRLGHRDRRPHLRNRHRRHRAGPPARVLH